tara:strand:- start:14916 stop:15281 length:366 start_codon:yes stop_codon:yes gene_type:complete
MSKLELDGKLYLNKRIAYTAILLQEYAYREMLDNPLVRGESRHYIKVKLKYIENQILQLNRSSKATKKQISEGEDVILDNVSIMAAIAATLAVIPNTQVDFVEEEFTKICLEAIERDTNGV